ncbi:MAG: hypothetical protein J6B87_05475, partial [Clostridia bacterium]|nr:hypothetical protein [Clostridia bacterium]
MFAQSSKTRQNSGITLIALVITIIVMLILVAVTISMAVNGGLFEYAGKAVGDTNNALKAEQDLGSGKVIIDNKVYNSIDEYLETKGGAGNGGNNAGEDIQGIDGEVFTAVYTETKSYTDKNGKTAMIPKGFSVGKSEGINTIAEGLVIQDAEGNQFVWIPVEYTA